MNLFSIISAFAPPAVFAISLFALPNGIWKIGQNRKRNPEIESFMKEYQDIEAKIARSFFIFKDKNTSLEEISNSYMMTKIQNSIEYAVNRHDWYENQRSAILNKTFTFFGIIVATIGIYFGQNAENTPDSYMYIALGIFSISMISTIYSSWLYNSELDQDRPYRLVSDIKFWYYRYNFPNRPKDPGGRLDYVAISKDILDERLSFFRRIKSSSSLERSVREDIEQLFILHILIQHKSNSLQRLRTAFFFSIIISTISLFILTLANLAFIHE